VASSNIGFPMPSPSIDGLVWGVARTSSVGRGRQAAVSVRVNPRDHAGRSGRESNDNGLRQIGRLPTDDVLRRSQRRRPPAARVDHRPDVELAHLVEVALAGPARVKSDPTARTEGLEGKGAVVECGRYRCWLSSPRGGCLGDPRSFPAVRAERSQPACLPRPNARVGPRPHQTDR